MSASRSADQQFCLRWNSFHSNLATSFHTLRSDEEFVDVTLAAEGQLIKAHRVVLSACSPFFKEILKSAPCHHPVVVLHEVRAAHVRDLLSFMYQGQVNLTPDQMPEFLRAAQALHVKGLFEDMQHQHQQPTSDNKETTPPPWSAPPPPPPPPLLDPRPATKRSESGAEAAASAAKKARVSSPAAAEPSVKTEPSSPSERRVSEEEQGDGTGAGTGAEHRLHGSRTSRADPTLSVHPSDTTDRSSRHQPAASQEGSSSSSRGHPTGPPPPPVTQPSQERTARGAAGGSGGTQSGSSHTAASPSCSSDPDYVVTHTAYPFPCPFCEKSYTSWGFRRRHIKAFHTSGPTLRCKWCWQVLPTHDDWCSHVTGEHHLSTGDAQHAIQILDEANLVLQSSEPLRLESLVDMVKRQQRRTSASPETALQGAASS